MVATSVTHTKASVKETARSANNDNRSNLPFVIINSGFKMATKPTNNIKNVLVLGTELAKTTEFCKMFEAYCLHDYKDASKWIPNIYNSQNEQRTLFLVDNLRFICSLEVGESFISKQVIYAAVNLEQLGLSAILILAESFQEFNTILNNFKSILFCVYQQLQDNILFVICNISCYNYNVGKRQICLLEPKETNTFHINQRTFYEITNAYRWEEAVNFCKRINNKILGESTSCLEKFYIHNNISTELLLNLINNLLELLVLSYCVSFDDAIYISDFKRNVTVCYNKQCMVPDEVNLSNSQDCIHLRTPRVCHAPCKCTKTNGDVASCIIFETPNKTCMQCKCNIKLHSQNYFKCGRWQYSNKEEKVAEREVIINILATFLRFQFQKQGEDFDYLEMFSNFLMEDNLRSMIIISLFNEKYASVKKWLSKTITNSEVIISVQRLYEINKNAAIIPKFMEEIFTEDVQFTIVTDKSIKAATSKEIKNDGDNSSADNLTEQNVVDLCSNISLL